MMGVRGFERRGWDEGSVGNGGWAVYVLRAWVGWGGDGWGLGELGWWEGVVREERG